MPEVGEPQGGYGDAGTEPTCQRQHAERVGAAAARHLLGRDDADQQSEGQADGRPMVCVPTSTQKFGAIAPSAHHSGASHAVRTIICVGRDGRRSIANGNGDHDAEPHDHAADALRSLVDAEAVGGETGRLGEQRVGERGRHRRRGEQTQGRDVARRQAVGRRPPRHRCRRAAGGAACCARGSANSQPNQGMTIR